MKRLVLFDLPTNVAPPRRVGITAFTSETEYAVGDQLNAAEQAQLAGDRRMTNPGSVGHPGNRLAASAYGILDMDGGTFMACRVPYDGEQTWATTGAVGRPMLRGT